MKRDPRLWFPLAFLAGGSLLTVAVLLLPKLARPQPTEVTPQAVPENRPDPRPWMKCEALAGLLRDQAPGLRFVHAPPYARMCYVCEGDAEPPSVLSEEDYADCWRGVVLCVADPTDAPEGPHSVRCGDFLLFGDVELLGKVRPTAEQIHFGPYRGTAR